MLAAVVVRTKRMAEAMRVGVWVWWKRRRMQKVLERRVVVVVVRRVVVGTVRGRGFVDVDVDVVVKKERSKMR